MVVRPKTIVKPLIPMVVLKLLICWQIPSYLGYSLLKSVYTIVFFDKNHYHSIVLKNLPSLWSILLILVNLVIMAKLMIGILWYHGDFAYSDEFGDSGESVYFVQIMVFCFFFLVVLVILIILVNLPILANIIVQKHQINMVFVGYLTNMVDLVILVNLMILVTLVIIVQSVTFVKISTQTNV